MDLTKMQAKMDAWFNSEEGQKSIEGYARKAEEERKRIEEQHKAFNPLSDIEFTKIVKEEANKHNSAWRDKCYKEGCEPYPYKGLNDLFSVAKEFGEHYEFSLSALDESFPSERYLYKNYYFVVTHGQGSVLRLYNTEKVMLFST